MALEAILESLYDHRTQMSSYQMLIVSQCIWTRRPNVNVLIFGCGYDTPVWLHINRDGKLLFIENNADWINRVQEMYPNIDVREVKYNGFTVESSLPIDENKLKSYRAPESICNTKWDVILIDAPSGYKGTNPGRALPIYWASTVATNETHIFIDDYERPLEKAYTDHFIRSKRPWNLEVPRQKKFGSKTHEVMLWSVGLGMISKSPI